MGVGSLLMTAAEQWALGKAKTMMTVTEGENVLAIKYYTKMGFIIDDVMLVYHKHNKEI